MADKYGYRKGAKGIDGNDGEGYDTKHLDKGAVEAMYGRAHWNAGGLGDITGEKGMGGNVASPDFSKDGEKRARSAVGGERKTGKAKR